MNTYADDFAALVEALELKAVAPNQLEPPFKATQLIVLVLFVVIAIAASIRFRNEQDRAA